MPARVAIVGLGRIGLPLALSFADRGLEVIGVDRDPRVLELVGEGRMPFEETGTQELLERVLPGGRLRLTDRIQDAAEADHVVLTLGTPTYVHVEIDVVDCHDLPVALDEAPGPDRRCVARHAINPERPPRGRLGPPNLPAGSSHRSARI